MRGCLSKPHNHAVHARSLPGSLSKGCNTKDCSSALELWSAIRISGKHSWEMPHSCARLGSKG